MFKNTFHAETGGFVQKKPARVVSRGVFFCNVHASCIAIRVLLPLLELLGLIHESRINIFITHTVLRGVWGLY